jgi:thiosulfate dehydrogenase [quinone] large subunit
MSAATHTPTTTVRPATSAGTSPAVRYVLAGLRLALGWIFLWAFLDKAFGLGRSTPSANAWFSPFEGFYHSIAGAGWADFLFMLGLAAVGVALIAGVGLRIAAVAGGVLLVMMWTAVLPPATNPFMDDHLIYAGLLALLALTAAGDTLGLGGWWSRQPLVQRLPWLR